MSEKVMLYLMKLQPYYRKFLVNILIRGLPYVIYFGMKMHDTSISKGTFKPKSMTCFLDRHKERTKILFLLARDVNQISQKDLSHVVFWVWRSMDRFFLIGKGEPFMSITSGSRMLVPSATFDTLPSKRGSEKILYKAYQAFQ